MSRLGVGRRVGRAIVHRFEHGSIVGERLRERVPPPASITSPSALAMAWSASRSSLPAWLAFPRATTRRLWSAAAHERSSTLGARTPGVSSRILRSRTIRAARRPRRHVRPSTFHRSFLECQAFPGRSRSARSLHTTRRPIELGTATSRSVSTSEYERGRRRRNGDRQCGKKEGEVRRPRAREVVSRRPARRAKGY